MPGDLWNACQGLILSQTITILITVRDFIPLSFTYFTVKMSLNQAKLADNNHIPAIYKEDA